MKQKDKGYNSEKAAPGSTALLFQPEKFFAKEVLENTGSILTELEMPLITRYETEVTHRVLNFWIKDGVIPSSVNENRKFSIVEYFWIRIADQMREMYVSLSLIKLLKNSLLKSFKIEGVESKAEKAEKILKSLKITKEQRKQFIDLLGKKDEQANVNTLQLLIVDYFLFRLPLNLIIFSDGSFMIERGVDSFSAEQKEKLLFTHYIKISLTDLIKKFLLSPLASKIFSKVSLIYYSELKALEALDSEKLKTIDIGFKSSLHKPIEIKAGKQARERLIEVLFFENEKQINQIALTDKKGESTIYDYKTVVL